jgi:hypothetical protein
MLNQNTTKRVESDVHKSLINTRVNGYKNEGHTSLKADIDSYDQPSEINGFIPDITSRKNDTFFITEAETCKTIDTEHTENQWKAFHDYALKNNAKFNVVIPESCFAKAKKIAKEIGVTVNRWYYNSNY